MHVMFASLSVANTVAVCMAVHGSLFSMIQRGYGISMVVLGIVLFVGSIYMSISELSAGKFVMV